MYNPNWGQRSSPVAEEIPRTPKPAPVQVHAGIMARDWWRSLYNQKKSHRRSEPLTHPMQFISENHNPQKTSISIRLGLARSFLPEKVEEVSPHSQFDLSFACSDTPRASWLLYSYQFFIPQNLLK